MNNGNRQETEQGSNLKYQLQNYILHFLLMILIIYNKRFYITNDNFRNYVRPWKR